jgi:putative transposase
MQTKPNLLPARKHVRLPDRSYSDPGMYFLTLCSSGKVCLFGEVVDYQMHCNTFGRIVEHALHWLPRQYPYLTLTEFVIMPNHIHVIIGIEESKNGCQPKAIGSLVGAFKTVSTKLLTANCWPNPQVWQRN